MLSRDSVLAILECLLKGKMPQNCVEFCDLIQVISRLWAFYCDSPRAKPDEVFRVRWDGSNLTWYRGGSHSRLSICELPVRTKHLLKVCLAVPGTPIPSIQAGKLDDVRVDAVHAGLYALELLQEKWGPSTRIPMWEVVWQNGTCFSVYHLQYVEKWYAQGMSKPFTEVVEGNGYSDALDSYYHECVDFRPGIDEDELRRIDRLIGRCRRNYGRRSR